MANAKDLTTANTFQRILAVGLGGAGKTSQLLTLPGKVFGYIFDPSALASLAGHDIEYALFLPEAAELDATLKGFNKNARPDDKPKGAREPTVYSRWVEDLNQREKDGFFKTIDWLYLDSLTLLKSALMDRQLWINNRYGSIEDLGDYRVTGSKLVEVLRSVFSLPVNIFCTGHLTSYQDEKTKKIEVQVDLPGKARLMLPLLCSNIWEFRATTEDEERYNMLTRPEVRGFQSIRSSIKDLPPVIDVTIKDFSHPGDYGVGAILAGKITKGMALSGNSKPERPALKKLQTLPASDSSAASKEPSAS
jgi:hypothetical protein